VPFSNSKETEIGKSYLMKEELQFFNDEPDSDYSDYSYLDNNELGESLTSTASELKKLGKKAQETRDKEFALTVERLQDLHGSLIARPSENEKAEDPRGLKIELMPHQQHALAWLMWREQQRPSGGVLGKY